MVRGLLISMRPRQWLKNGFVLPALVFSRHLQDQQYVVLSVAAFVCFCLLSSAVYLINDVTDAAQDRLHPRKSTRPIASRRLSAPLALGVAGGLLVAAVGGAYALEPRFGIIAVVYAGANLGYSLRLKHVVLIDVLLVATGFLLRAVGGAVVLDVPISPWFILCTFSLALFLAVVKRRQELVLLQDDAYAHRVSLGEYSVPFLDQVIALMAAATLVCYALYAMGVGTGSQSNPDRSMQWTIPFVLYGILRYLYLVHQTGAGESPTAVIWQDRPLQVNLLLWLIASVLGYYVLP